MEQEINSLYNKYAEGFFDRREFFKRLTCIAGGTAAAYTILSQLGVNHVEAEIISKDDSRLHTETILYPAATGDMRAYWARPKGKEKLPCVVVIHENRGLNDHIRDVTRRIVVVKRPSDSQKTTAITTITL